MNMGNLQEEQWFLETFTDTKKTNEQILIKLLKHKDIGDTFLVIFYSVAALNQAKSLAQYWILHIVVFPLFETQTDNH